MVFFEAQKLNFGEVQFIHFSFVACIFGTKEVLD